MMTVFVIIRLFLLMLILLIFFSCASYTVNISTVPPAQVEVYINEEYHKTTTEDGKASVKIDAVAFEDEHLVEVKNGKYYGFLKINHKGETLEEKNVYFVSTSVNNENVSVDKVTYNIIFVVPEKLEDEAGETQTGDELPVAEAEDINDYFSMEEPELDAQFEISRYIATNQEIKTYSTLNVEGKQGFLARFWRDRDTNPQTKINEFQRDYFKRVELANARFSSNKKEGWKTDEGRIIIIYGIPDAVDRFPSNMDQKAYQVWYYYRVQGGVQFVFVDVRNFGEMELVHSTARNEVHDPSWQRWLK